jgi:hypothetical protein
LANDRLGFAEAYRRAVEVAREKGEDDPEQAVLQAFKQRNPVTSVFGHKPTEREMRDVYGALDENGQRAVSEALTLFDNYTDLIAPNPIVRRIKQQMKAQVRATQPPTIEQLRRRAASGAMAY